MEKSRHGRMRSCGKEKNEKFIRMGNRFPESDGQHAKAVFETYKSGAPRCISRSIALCSWLMFCSIGAIRVRMRSRDRASSGLRFSRVEGAIWLMMSPAKEYRKWCAKVGGCCGYSKAIGKGAGFPDSKHGSQTTSRLQLSEAWATH